MCLPIDAEARRSERPIQARSRGLNPHPPSTPATSPPAVAQRRVSSGARAKGLAGHRATCTGVLGHVPTSRLDGCVCPGLDGPWAERLAGGRGYTCGTSACRRARLHGDRVDKFVHETRAGVGVAGDEGGA